MKKMNRAFAAVLAGVMAFSMIACGSNKDTPKDTTGGGDSTQAQSEAGISYPGTPDADMITVDLRAEPPEMNSLLTTDVAAGDVLREVMAGLTKLDGNDVPQPDMAESWDISDDKLTYTMHLRKDAKWSNGEPVTAHDFVYAWQLVCTPETASPYAYIVYENIKNGAAVYEGKKDISELGVKAIDDYTLEVQLETPVPYALHLFSFSTYLPVNQKAYEEIGADKYAKDADKLVTNGAYKMTEWVHDDHILLEKNEDYFGAANIEIQKVKLVMMKDENARMNAFKGGQVDAIDLTGDQVEQAKNEGMAVQSYIDNGNWYLQYNIESEFLSNKKIRQAISMAVDRQLMCDNVLKDGSVPATGVTPNAILGSDGKPFTDAVGTLLVSDAAKAKELFDEGLAELGKKAEDVKISFITDDTTNAQKIGAYIQEQIKQSLGITVDLQPMPFKSRIQKMQGGDFDMVFAGWAPDYNDPMTYLDMWMTDNGNNYGHFSNEEFDKLITDAKKETDTAKRQEMLVEAEKLLAEEMPLATLYFSAKPYIVSSKVEGITRTGFQEWDFTDGAKIVK